MNVIKLLTAIFFIYCNCCNANYYEDDGIVNNNNENEDWSLIDEDFNPEFNDETSNNEIAAIVAQTGDAGFLGRVVRAGFEKAISDLKQMCSNGECQVPKVYYSNTGSSPERALTLFKKYYSKGVRIFIGFVTSDEAKMVADYAQKHASDARLVSATSTATELCMYKNLDRMTMDDRGYAEVLFDFSVHFKKDSPLSIQIINRDDVHGNGLASDIKKRFSGEASKEGYKVLPPITYKGGKGVTQSNFIKKLLQSPIKKEKHSLIVLTGLAEAQLILLEASKHSSLKRHTWILSDALTLSRIKIPRDMNVFGLSFVGDEATSKLLNKERRGLKQYLQRKKLPPMSQAQLAYDVISVIQKSITQCNRNMLTEGLTGPLEFSKCNERTTGSYALVVNPKILDINNVLRNIIMKKWMVISHYIVESKDRSIKELSLMDDLSPEMIMEVELESTSKKGVSSLASPSIEIKKSDLLEHLVKIGDKTCYENAQLTIQSHDELSQTPVNVTYTVASMPESIVLPVRYGFIIFATCHTGRNHSLSLTRVCPPTKVGGSEIMCQTKVSNTAIGKVNAEGAKCIGTTVGTVACYAGVGGCYVASIATSFSTTALCAIGSAGCGALGIARATVCKRGKYVCTELFRQGYLPPDIMLADMSFAKHYSDKNPITRKGYDILGPAVASWMSSSEMMTDLAKSIAIPWAEEMAYNEGYRETGNDLGATVMSVGSVVCGLVGGVYMYFNYIIGTMILIVTVVVAKHIKFAKCSLPTTGRSFAKKVD